MPIVLIFTSCNEDKEVKAPVVKSTLSSKKAVAPKEYRVSMINLIANPDKYHGKKIAVTGFAHFRFEDDALYLTKDDAKYLHGKNGLWLSIANDNSGLQANDYSMKDNLKYFDNKFVRIQGTFDKTMLGHMGANSGSITKITRVLESKDYDKK